MKIIKNSEELAELVNENKDLVIDEDVRIEFEPSADELRDVKCRNLYLENDNERFDFNGRDFNGWNFNGWNFNGKKVSYYAFFNCYNDIKYEGEIKGRKNPHAKPVSLMGVIVDKLEKK